MALRSRVAALAASLGESCSAVATAAAARPQGAGLAQAAVGCLQQQQRQYISVDVPNGNVDRAWRTLSRKLKEENYMAAAQSREFYVKRSEKRKQAAAASQAKLRKEEFRTMLGWIMKRRARGF